VKRPRVLASTGMCSFHFAADMVSATQFRQIIKPEVQAI
jgi:hypothetical protein